MRQDGSIQRHTTRERLNASRRRAFWVATLAFPFVVVFLLEAILQLLHYGPDLSLFTTQELNGRHFLIMNPAVRHRYFSRISFAPSSSPDYFLDPKPAGVFRIFCLGGSTTVGFPYWYNASFSSFLRDRLQSTFPDRAIEVINLGMTATNSYTVLDMTEDLFELEPDLLIVYDGHNEFYGALGTASRESFGGSRWLSKLSLKFVHLRTYQFALDLIASVHALLDSDEGAMMERLARGRTVPYGNRMYNDGLRVFTANLNELKELCARHGVPLVIGTQVSNLRGQIPFVSGIPVDMPSAARLDFHARFNAGIEHQLNGDFPTAIADFRDAARMIPNHAEAHFRLAQCLDTLGRTSEALQEFITARDFDELRFRASSDFNSAIRAMQDGHLFLCADVEAAFAAASPDSIIGNNLVLEHLHPNAYGQFLIARTIARTLRSKGILTDQRHWAVADTLADAGLWNKRHVTPLDERIAARRTEALVTAWPFQPEDLPLDDIPASDTLGTIADRFAHGEFNWKQAHDSAATFYALQGNPSSMEREFRTIINQLPYVDTSPYLRLAELLLKRNAVAEARTLLLRSLAIQPDCQKAVQMLARIDSLR